MMKKEGGRVEGGRREDEDAKAHEEELPCHTHATTVYDKRL
jgi:hypothetical protein